MHNLMYSRGNLVLSDDEGNAVYEDGSHFDDYRPCTNCDLPCEPDQPDPCIGLLDGVDYACCSHGIDGEGYVCDDEGRHDFNEWAKAREVWKLHPTYTWYSVSSYGQIKSHNPLGPKRILKTTIRPDGYVDVRIKVAEGKWKSIRMHTLVLETFVGERPEGMEARHLDGNGLNNRLDNLEWSSHHTNCLDKRAHGTMIRGEASKSAKLAEDDVLKIYSLLDSGSTIADVARLYRVDRSTISRINSGDKWSYMLPRRGKSVLQ